MALHDLSLVQGKANYFTELLRWLGWTCFRKDLLQRLVQRYDKSLMCSTFIKQPWNYSKIIVIILSIVQEERIQMSIGVYMREEHEIRAPFNDPGSPVRRAGLVLHAIHRKNYDCALHAKYRNDLEEKG